MPADRDMCVEMIEVPLVQNMTWGSNKDEGSQESKILGQVHGIILSFKNNAGNLFTKGRKHALNHLRLFFENEERCSAFEKTLEDTIKRGDLETRSSEQGYNAELDDNRRRHSNTVFFDLSQGKAEDEADENTRDLSVLEMPASTVGETRQKDWPPRKLVDKSLADGHLQEFESLLLEDKAVGIAGVAEIMESSQDVAETVYVNHSPRGGTVDSQQTTRSRPRSQQPGQDAKVDITSAVVHGGKEQGKKQGKAAQIYPANSNTTHVTDSYDTSDDTSFPPDAVQHLQRSSGVREGVSTNDIAENMQTLVQNQMETPASEALTTHDISRPEIDPHIAASISSVIADHTNRDSPLRPAQAHSKPQVALPPLNESSLPEADGRISSETTQFPFLPRSEGNHCGLKRPLLARIGPVDEDDVDWDQDLRDSASDIDPPKSKRNKVTKSKSKKSTGRGASSKQKIVVTAARPAGRASATAGARMMKTKKAHDQVEQTLASTRARRTVAKTSAKVAEGAQFDIENERQSSPLLQDTDQSVEPEQRIGLDGIIQMEDSQSQGNGRASSLEDHSHSVLDDVIITSRRSELLVEDSADISILPVNNVPSNRTSKLLPWNRELSEDRAGSDDQQDTGELGITFEKAMQDLDLFRDRQPVAAAEHTGSAHDSQPLDTTEHLKLLDQPTTTFGTKMTQLLKEIALVPEQPTERASTPPFGDPKAFVELVNTTKSSSHQKPRPHEFAPAIRPDMLPSMSAKSVPRTVDEQRTCSKQPAGSFARGAEQDESAAPTLGPIYISSDRESEASEAALVDPSNCAQESLVNKKVPTGSERINDELGTRASKRDNRYSLADKSQQLRTSAEDNIMTSPPFSPKRVSAKKVTFQATRTAGEAEDPSQENLQNAATDSNEAVQEDVSPKKMDDDADPAALDKSLTDRINSPQGASLAKSPPSNKLGAGGVYPDRVRETRHIAPQLNLEGHRTPNGPVSHVSDLALVLTDERKHRKTQITSLSAKRPRNQAVVSPVKRDKRSPSSGRAPAGNPKHHAFKAQQHIQATQADREFQRVPIASAVPQCNEASGKYWDEPSDGIFAREESADEHLLVERNPAKETGQNACQGSKVDENGSPRLRGSPESPSSAQALPSPLKQPSFVASRIDQSPMFIRGLDIRGARKAGCNSAAASLPEHSDLGPSPSPHTAFAVTTGMAKSRSSIGLSIVMDRNFPSASTTMNTDAFKLPKASSTFHNTNTTLVVKTSSDDAVMTEHTPDTQMRDTSETGERKASPFHFKDIDTTLPSTRSTAAPIIVRRLRPTSPFATIADAQNEDVTPLSFNTRVQNMMPPPAKPAHAIILDLRSKRGRTTARPDAEDADLTLVEAESFAQHAGVRTIRQVRNDRSSESSQESHSSPASATSHQLKRRQEDLNLWRTKVRSTYQKLGDIATEITNVSASRCPQSMFLTMLMRYRPYFFGFEPRKMPLKARFKITKEVVTASLIVSPLLMMTMSATRRRDRHHKCGSFIEGFWQATTNVSQLERGPPRARLCTDYRISWRSGSSQR